MGQLPKLGLLLIDVQEKLFPKVCNYDLLLKKLQILISACDILEIPILQTEQYPQGLGETLSLLKRPRNMAKTAFSCLGDEKIAKEILNSPVEGWILAGIETHVCVLQTAKDLKRAMREVIVPVDAVSSRYPLDHETALEELRAAGVRVTTIETILFEILGDSKESHFKAISRLIK